MFLNVLNVWIKEMFLYYFSHAINLVPPDSIALRRCHTYHKKRSPLNTSKTHNIVLKPTVTNRRQLRPTNIDFNEIKRKYKQKVDVIIDVADKRLLNVAVQESFLSASNKGYMNITFRPCSDRVSLTYSCLYFLSILVILCLVTMYRQLNAFVRLFQKDRIKENADEKLTLSFSLAFLWFANRSPRRRSNILQTTLVAAGISSMWSALARVLDNVLR